MRAAVVVVTLGIAASACSVPDGARPAAPDQSTVSQGSQDGGLFSPLDLGFYEQPDRVQWQKPEQIMDALGLADGSVVAEIGAGSGWFMIQLARRVGPGGRVYAEDIQPPMIEVMKRRVQRENLSNVTTILGTANDPRLPHGLDVVLIVSVYGEMEDPVALLENAARSLKPQGCIGVVDFIPGGGGPGPAPNERVDPDTVIEGASAAGLTLVARDTIPPFSYSLVFGTSAGARCAR